jgi:hypothetical protein
MARFPSPTKTHKPKDLCTIEQSEYIALETIKSTFAQLYRMERTAEQVLAKRNAWYRRIWRALRNSQ